MKCPFCGAPATVRDSSYVYGRGHDYGKLWVCTKYPMCDSYVGCHGRTTTPLGTMANKALRIARGGAHRYFDNVWKVKKIKTRSEAYAWLAKEMGLSADNCHIAMFNIEQCTFVVNLCRPFMTFWD